MKKSTLFFLLGGSSLALWAYYKSREDGTSMGSLKMGDTTLSLDGGRFIDIAAPFVIKNPIYREIASLAMKKALGYEDDFE